MVGALDDALPRRVVRACGEFVDAQKTVDGAGKLRTKLEAIIRRKSCRSPLNRNVAVDEDASYAFGD